MRGPACHFQEEGLMSQAKVLGQEEPQQVGEETWWANS